MSLRKAVEAVTSSNSQKSALAQKWHTAVSDAQEHRKRADHEQKASSEANKRAFLPFIQSAQLSLAALFRSRCDYDNALPIYEKCLEERVQYLGDKHPETLLISNAVAYTLHLKGEHERALPLLEESLAQWQAIHGQDHPNSILYVPYGRVI
jgi:tetratricopeptide (TPR) repeat protein